MKYPFFKKHKNQNRFWSFNDKKWVQVIPDRDCVIINFQGYNIHPSQWEDSWFFSQNITIREENISWGSAIPKQGDES